jgi:hypothetical protein
MPAQAHAGRDARFHRQVLPVTSITVVAARSSLFSRHVTGLPLEGAPMNRMIRNPLLAACGLALLALPARAQSPARQAQSVSNLPTYTLFMGMNLADVEGPTFPNKEAVTGMAFGIGMDWKLNTALMLQPELQYSQKGYQYNPSGVAVKLRLTYIEVPVMLRANTPVLENGMRLYGLFGPAIAMRSSCGANVGSSRGLCNQLSADLSSMDYGIVGGLGMDFRIRSAKLTASLRYDLGKADIDKTEDGSAKSRALSLLVGWNW